MKDHLFDSTIGALNTSMNLRLLRQNVISSNIANADTPGYKAKDIEFEQAFRQILDQDDGRHQLAATSPGHIAQSKVDAVQPQVYEKEGDVISLDGNTVDRSEEMANLAENQALYDASVELLRKKLGMLKHAVADGGGQ